MTRTRLTAGLLTLLLLALPITASAQLAPTEVYTGKAFQLAWTHDGVNTNKYQYFRWQGTATPAMIAELPVASRVNGEIIFDSGGGTQGLPIGVYNVRCDAIGDGGTTASAVFQITVKALPTAPTTPTLPRIIRIG